MDTFMKFLPTYWVGEALYQLFVPLWTLFRWFFLMSWWVPTTLIGKLLKPPIVLFVNIPGSLPATAAWAAMSLGVEMPFMVA